MHCITRITAFWARRLCSSTAERNGWLRETMCVTGQQTGTGIGNLPASKIAKKFQYNPPRSQPRHPRPPGNKPGDPTTQLQPSQMLSSQQAPKQMTRGDKWQNGSSSQGVDGEKNGEVAPRVETRSTESPKKQVKEASPAEETAEAGSVDESLASKEEPKYVKVLDETEILSLELAKVADFQKQQKAMEELNKQKKLQLMKALEQRRLKAKAEAVKLSDIQKELGHLDALLSSEVRILRDKIEDASIVFLEAQKRYEKAEKEFVAAKLDLHRKSDNKEQLTDHLYTIIYQNEVRKAKKLAELMEKLEMECSAEDLTVDLPPLPHITMMNSVQTLGPRGPVSPTHSGHSLLSQDHTSSTTQSPSPRTSQPISPITAQPTSPDRNNSSSDTQNSSPQSSAEDPTANQTTSLDKNISSVGEKQTVDGSSEELIRTSRATDAVEGKPADDKSQVEKDLGQENKSSLGNSNGTNPVC